MQPIIWKSLLVLIIVLQTCRKNAFLIYVYINYAKEKQDSNKHFSLSGTPFSRTSGVVTFDVLPGITNFIERSALCKIMH